MEKRKFRRNDIVKRHIEGVWFLAEVETVGTTHVSLKYLDDGNIEHHVPIEEVEKERDSHDAKSLTPRRVDNLPRPLAGLVDDDYDIRNKNIPTVFIHEDGTLDEAIVLNGAENKLAAGGGLRALRYLKN